MTRTIEIDWSFWSEKNQRILRKYFERWVESEISSEYPDPIKNPDIIIPKARMPFTRRGGFTHEVLNKIQNTFGIVLKATWFNQTYTHFHALGSIQLPKEKREWHEGDFQFGQHYDAITFPWYLDEDTLLQIIDEFDLVQATQPSWHKKSV